MVSPQKPYRPRKLAGWPRGQIDIHAGTEANEAEPLPLLQSVFRLHITQDAARDQAGNLHAGHVRAAFGMDPQRIALILE